MCWCVDVNVVLPLKKRHTSEKILILFKGESLSKWCIQIGHKGGHWWTAWLSHVCLRLCFLLLLAMLHVSFSHAWSASKPKEERVDIFSQAVHLFNNPSKKVHVFPWNLLQKMPRKSSLFVALGECHFSTSWWHLLGKSQPACDEPWMNKHNATRGTIEKSTMANIPHVNCDCTEHWLHLTIRHSNELGVSLKGSKSSDRGKIIHQVCTESHSYKARHGNESLCKNVRSLN